jgi:hypothetical protein
MDQASEYLLDNPRDLNHELSEFRNRSLTALKSVFGTALLLIACASALAAPSRASSALVEVKEAKPSRLLANRALEIPRVESFVFRSSGTCDQSVDFALRLAGPVGWYVDPVDADCAAPDPPPGSAEPEVMRLPRS